MSVNLWREVKLMRPDVEKQSTTFIPEPRNVLPNGLTLLQVNPDCAVSLSSNKRDYGWLYVRGADHQWMTHRKLSEVELRQAHDQAEDMVILQGGGLLVGTVPMWNSVWAWGDPSHKRVIQKESFIFLSQKQYTAQVGKTAMSDFRYLYRGDFEATWLSEQGVTFSFILQAIK